MCLWYVTEAVENRRGNEMFVVALENVLLKQCLTKLATARCFCGFGLKEDGKFP